MLALRAKSPVTDADRAELEALAPQVDVKVPMRIAWQRGSDTATVTLQDTALTLKVGQWSDWVDLRFRINLFIAMRGMAQVILLRADDDLQLYVSPINWRPEAPPLPISSPTAFAESLVKTLGPFRTLGWAEATWPLEEGRIDEAVFMEDLSRAFDDRARVILNRIDARQWDLLVGVIETTDRVQHMMWRLIDQKHPMYDAALAAKYGDAIERIYRRSDAFVGEVLKHVDPDTAVMVVSDHGFHSFRKAVNLNTWLVQEGFMVLKGQQDNQRKLDDLFGAGTFWEGVDWSRTRAYAMGLGQIYFNVRGREGQGIVSPGQESVALADAITARLATLVDPDTGERVVQNVYRRDDVYSGRYLENASDLQVGFADGYRVSWQTSLGGAPAGIVYPNMKKWSADHGSFDIADTSGVLITSRPLGARDRYRITDVAPSVLEYFGLTPGPDLDGKSLLR